MKRIATAALALVCCLTLARSVYAADANLEFGVADDLTVLGKAGTAVDPDVEVQGFTVFGATQPSYNGVSAAAGNVVVNGQLSVSSGAYLVGGTTVTDGAYFAASSTFATTVNISSANALYVGGGTTSQVLKKAANGSMIWSDDQTGASALTGNAMYIPYFTGATIDKSQMLTNSGLTSITLITSSMTIQGTGGDGLGVTGATKLNGLLNVTGPTTLLGATYLGDAPTRSTFTAAGNIYMALNSSITLTGSGQIYLPNAPVIGNDAANKAYVDSKSAMASPWVRVDAINVVKLSTAIDTVGVGIAVPRAKLHVASSAVSGDNLFAVSTGTVNNTQDIFAIDVGVNGVGEAGIKGNLAIGQTYASGSAPANGIAVQGAVGIGANTAGAEAGNMMRVQGVDAAGQYISTFYSGNKLAAWVRQK